MKKIILVLALALIFTCVLVVTASASSVYKTADGEVLFSYTDENGDYVFDSYEGEFPKTDADGNHLTWYIVSKATENGNTVYTVASLKTLGEAGNINGNGVYSFISPVTNRNTVSVNYPDNAGILRVPEFGSYGTRAQNNILFAYMPNTLTELPESLFQETPVLIGEIDDETPVTFIPHKLCHEARNIKVVNIPASVTLIKSIDDRNGAPFCNTYSLKTVTFAEGSKLTRIQAYAFISSNIEEIQFPNSLVAVNQNLFRGCRNLKVIRFGEGFKYFENVNNEGNPTTNHHSVTHTATGLLEIYLPASFYLAKPDVNYRVSYAFDGCSNAKFFFTGSAEQLKTAIANFTNNEWTTGATDHNYLVDAYKANKIVSYKDYVSNEESYSGRYIIVDYNKCDAFYKGEHLDEGNTCTINCARCEVYGVTKENPVHKMSTTITYESFDKNGVKAVACSNKGCTHGSIEETSALFNCMGYSVQESNNNGIVIGYTINKKAINEYKEITGSTLKYGGFAALKDKIGESDIFDDNGNAKGGAIHTDISSHGFDLYEFKIVGFKDDYKDVKLALGVYASITKDGATEYFYMQEGTKTENEKYVFVSYNDLIK